MTPPTTRPKGTPPRYTKRSPLRDRVLACLRESRYPISTTDLALLCGGDVPNPRQRVWEVLTILQQRGRVRRVSPLMLAGRHSKKPSLRWVLVEGGAT